MYGNDLAQKSINFIRSFVFTVCDGYLESDCRLSSQQLRRLGEHKYAALDISWLDELCMKRFWDEIVKFYPIWLAPNVITLVGLIINIATVIILSYFSFDAQTPAPKWAYFQAAIGLFLYQTLDATDGKQARRTGSASPLGELFDHGCDSVTQVFVTMNISYALCLGETPFCVLTICVIAIIMFYCAHWSTYCTGQLRFSRFDVTEAQLCVISLLLLTSLFGPEVWSIRFGVPCRYIVIGGSLIMSIWQIFGYISVVFVGGAGKNGSTVAGTSVLFPLCPLLAVVIPFVMIYGKAMTDVYDRNITLFCMCFGFVAAKASNRLVIAHMSKSPLVLWDWIYLSPLLMMLNQYYDVRFAGELTLLWISTV